MDVCVRLFCVCVALCVVSGLATGWSPVQGVLPCKKDYETEEEARAQQRAVVPLLKWMNEHSNILNSIFGCLLIPMNSLCSEVNSHPTDRVSPASYETQTFITSFTRTHHWTLFWHSWIKSTPSRSVSGRSCLSSCFQLRLNIPGGFVHPLHPLCVLHTRCVFYLLNLLVSRRSTYPVLKHPRGERPCFTPMQYYICTLIYTF
jgi:hypothetical protein